MEFFKDLFKANFMPHGHCYFWQADVLWSNVIGDGIIALAYFLIPFALYYFVKKRQITQFRGIFFLFATFIFLCGLTHIIEIISVWVPVYRLAGLVKILTGAVSVATASVLIYHLPTLLKVPSAKELEEVNTQLQRKRDELKNQNEFLRNLAYSTYHDLREPVRGMAINAQLLASRHSNKLDEGTSEIVNHIARESKRMFNSVDSILKFTFLESEKYTFSQVDLNKVLMKSLDSLNDLIKTNFARVKCEKLPVIEGNENLLGILFENVISNSIRFRRQAHPQIMVEADYDDANCVIRISDNGIGFDNKYKHQIFEMFKTLGNSTTYKGSGLGLAMCRRITEIHSGTIEAFSVEGSGTIITITLPKEQKTHQQQYEVIKQYSFEGSGSQKMSTTAQL